MQLPEGVVLEPAELTQGVWKYVIVSDYSPDHLISRFACVKATSGACRVEHSQMVLEGERVVGAGFFAVLRDADGSRSFIVNNPTSGSLDHEGDAEMDAAILAHHTGMTYIPSGE